MKRISEIAGIAFLTAILGIAVSFFPEGLMLEERLGLDLLFKLRGPRKPPSEILIVSMDPLMAPRANLPKDPKSWPRSLHAELVENLSGKGAEIICFDVFFKENGGKEENDRLADSMRSAGNVILYEEMKRIPLAAQSGELCGLDETKIVPPIPVLADCATAKAPFLLPEKPAQVSQYWTFKSELRDNPTLPVVMFHVYARDIRGQLWRLLEKASPSGVEELLCVGNEVTNGTEIETRVRTIRTMFKNNPAMGDRLLYALESGNTFASDPAKRRMLRSLVKLYKGGESRHLNFYGPPGTIPTISYQQALQDETFASGSLTGKAVLVGLSELYDADQEDDFPTVFSRSDGIDLCGVEILATAFANLLEDFPIEPLPFFAHLLFVFTWGGTIGLVCRFVPAFPAVSALFGASALYVTVAFYQFKNAGIWYPLVIPLLIQTPFAFFASVLWKNHDIKKERKTIRKTFGYYIPDQLVDQLVDNLSDIRNSKQMVHGTCMFTDAKHFASLSESVDPMELGRVMNQYYGEISKPIARHGGILSRIVGDAMLVIWASMHPDPNQGHRACHAALDIAKAVSRFHSLPNAPRLPTRIGVHSGHFFYGNIGSEDHFDYTPMGDAVNAASRLEGLNKKLGTWILVSEDVLGGTDGVLSRKVGDFRLAGKSAPIAVHELISYKDESEKRDEELCAAFGDALAAFKRESWDEATGLFHKCMELREKDGPSAFYLTLCDIYKANPPGEEWNGVIHVGK